MHSATMPIRSAATSELFIRQQVYPQLRVSVLVVLLAFVAYFLFRLREDPVANVLWAIAITVTALAPAYCWASGYVGGLPIFPAHLATLVLTFATPLASGMPEISQGDVESISFASFCIVLYACVASACWILALRGNLNGRRTFRVLPMARGFSILLGILALGAIYNTMLVAGLVTLEAGLYSVVRAATIATTSIAMFVVAVRLGGRSLTSGQRVIAMAVIAVFVLSQISTLYLGSAIISTMSLVVGISIGRQRIPWAIILVALVVIGILHAGKGEMRSRYWWGAESQTLSVGDLPAFMADWFAAGLRRDASPAGEAQSQSIYERLSLMHLLLLAEGAAQSRSEQLDGATYALIPATLVPRFMDPDKPSSHEATNLLNRHYGLQSADEQESTMIGWGMINEGYANFGLYGILAVAVAMGTLLGIVTRMGVGEPFMSLRNFFGILVLVIAVQTELTAVVFVTALLQSTVSMLLLWPFCEIQRVPARA